jgi:hypothetical protein
MVNLAMNRKGETGHVPFRSGRFYCVGNEWYFAVRRDNDHGPFASRTLAKEALTNFINDQLNFEKLLESNKDGINLQSNY